MTKEDFRQILIEARDAILADLRKRRIIFYADSKWPEATTWDINRGWCEDFVRLVERKVEGVEEKWMDDLGWEETGPLVSHAIVKYEGRYYDAECIEGADDWHDMPVYCNAKQHLSREQVLATRNQV